MKIGVYVGSFNPPHMGHMKVIEYLLENHYVDKIEVIPTGNYWNKTNLIDTIHRINMLKVYENKDVVVNDELNTLPYTYQVLDSLKKKYPSDELMLIIGDDNLPKFHLWKNYQEILENKVIVLRRNDINIKETISYQYNPNSFIMVNDFPKVDISSTDIRTYLQEGRLNEALPYLGLYALTYIVNHNLYDVFNKENDNNFQILDSKEKDSIKKYIKIK